jgi:proteasome lid subunit RPN8/RPN11
MNEIYYLFVGQRRGRIWHGRLRRRQIGQPHGVEFDWQWALEREERYGDVAGFYHTHAPGHVVPSERDVRTMRAWVSCLGKPLLCLIESGGTLHAYLFATDEDKGLPLAEVQRFPRNAVVAVEG